MRYRMLGKTGIEVSTIGFGAATLGDVYGVTTVEDGRSAVHHAIDCGINLFDVSPYYGITLATKCGRYGFSDFDFSAAAVTRGLEDSLRRLRTDYVDLLQIHDVEFGSIDQIIHETLPALRVLQEQGKARFIGVTGYWPALLARIAAATPVDTVLNYCHWNLLMDDMDRELTPLAAQQGFGLMNASPLHMGLLSGAGGPEWHPAPQQVKQVATAIGELCLLQHGVSPATLGLSVCLRHPAVASTFIGIRSVAQVDDSLRALEYEPPAELLAEIRALAAPVFNTVWPSGLEENQPASVAHAS